LPKPECDFLVKKLPVGGRETAMVGAGDSGTTEKHSGGYARMGFDRFLQGNDSADRVQDDEDPSVGIQGIDQEAEDCLGALKPRAKVEADPLPAAGDTYHRLRLAGEARQRRIRSGDCFAQGLIMCAAAGRDNQTVSCMGAQGGRE
jgi:hypothetical protein